jgi:nucleotide-binding universal stress UspA family protein
MFKHILLPTDGSALAAPMIKQTMAFARDVKARVTVMHVQSEFHVFTIQPEMLADTREQYRRDSAAQAQRFLDQAVQEAKEMGVACDTLLVEHEQPYEAIVEAAKDHGCDIICMASHGRRGVKGLLLGSETQKVLVNSDVPVLVFR